MWRRVGSHRCSLLLLLVWYAHAHAHARESVYVYGQQWGNRQPIGGNNTTDLTRLISILDRCIPHELELIKHVYTYDPDLFCEIIIGRRFVIFIYLFFYIKWGTSSYVLCCIKLHCARPSLDDWLWVWSPARSDFLLGTQNVRLEWGVDHPMIPRLSMSAALPQGIKEEMWRQNVTITRTLTLNVAIWIPTSLSTVLFWLLNASNQNSWLLICSFKSNLSISHPSSPGYLTTCSALAALKWRGCRCKSKRRWKGQWEVK